MKVFSKRGSAVLDAPEDTYAQLSQRNQSAERGQSAEWIGRGPAPAGALQRAPAGGYKADKLGGRADGYDGAFDGKEEGEDAYRPRLGSLRMRLRGKVPGSLAGRIAAGAAVMVVLGAGAAAVLGARTYLLHDERFVIPASSQIQTVGNIHMTRAQLLSVFGEDVERNIFKVPLETRRADLERLPWVQHATVMRLLPNRIRVAVTERTPVAFVRQGTHIGLVDAAGVLLDMPEDSAGDPHYSFPVLTGLSPDDPLSTRAARMEIYRRFIKELDGSGQKISDSLSEVDVSSPEDVKALIPSGGTDILVHFGDEQFLERYRQFEAHLPDWKTQYPKLASADMRYDRQVVLEMAPGAGVPLSVGPAVTAADAPAAPKPMAAVAKPAKPAVRASGAAKINSASNARVFAALAAARQPKPGAKPDAKPPVRPQAKPQSGVQQ